MDFLGIETSQAGTHAVVLDLEAATVRTETWVPHPSLADSAPDTREQDPVQWLAAVDQAVRKCLAAPGVDGARIAAIGVAGPQRGWVMLDDADRIVRSAKRASDPAATSEANEIGAAFGGVAGLLDLTGQVPGKESAAAECLWLRNHAPDDFRRVAQILTPQDFLAYWLTGERGAEPGSASTTGLLDVRTHSYCHELVDFIDPRLAAMLPPITSTAEPRGVLRSALASEWGLPASVFVSAGGSTPMLAALAAGCVRHGAVAIEMGPSGCIAAISDQPIIDHRGEIAGMCSASGKWLALASIGHAAVLPETVQHHHGWNGTELESMAASVPAGAEGLMWLPYLNGGSLPWQKTGAGMLHGIRPENFTPAHLARAATDGVALGFGSAMHQLRELGIDPSEIRLHGRGSLNSFTCQLLADALGVQVAPVTSPHGAALGAAIHSAIAFFRQHRESLGFEEIASYFVVTDPAACYQPDPDRHALYQEMIARQQYLVDTLQPAGHR